MHGPLRTSPEQGRLARNALRIETGATGLEPATSGVTGRRSNQLNYAPERIKCTARFCDGLRPPGVAGLRGGLPPLPGPVLSGSVLSTIPSGPEPAAAAAEARGFVDGPAQ